MIRHLALAVLLAGLSTPVMAGEIADKAALAEQLMSQGKFVEATEALEAAHGLLAAQTPMTIRRAVFVAGEPGGFGVYDLRGNSAFKRGEELIIYAEPIGFGYSRDGSLYTIDLSLDFVVKDKAGAEIGRQDNFGTLSFRTRFPNKEFFAKVNYNFSGLPPGDYTVITVMRDKATQKMVDFTMPFSLTD